MPHSVRDETWTLKILSRKVKKEPDASSTKANFSSSTTSEGARRKDPECKAEHKLRLLTADKVMSVLEFGYMGAQFGGCASDACTEWKD